MTLAQIRTPTQHALLLLEDREGFYRKEFDTEKVKRWLNWRSNKTVIAVIIMFFLEIEQRVGKS